MQIGLCARRDGCSHFHVGIAQMVPWGSVLPDGFAKLLGKASVMKPNASGWFAQLRNPTA
jgi:hypothetical protein